MIESMYKCIDHMDIYICDPRNALIYAFENYYDQLSDIHIYQIYTRMVSLLCAYFECAISASICSKYDTWKQTIKDRAVYN